MIIEQIINIYQNKMPKNPIMLSDNEAEEYFERLLMNGNIITYIKNGSLLGFLEFWRIDYSQFGRLCCNWTLSHDEDLLNGNIALITRMWIEPEFRNGEVFQILSAMFIAKNQDATHYAAFQYSKKHKPLQVYSREELIRHYNQ